MCIYIYVVILFLSLYTLQQVFYSFTSLLVYLFTCLFRVYTYNRRKVVYVYPSSLFVRGTIHWS